MKPLFCFVLYSLFFLGQSAAQETFAFTKDGVALHVTNTGNNLLVELNKADSIFTFSTAAASFAPGKKLDWHYHPGGQILLITEGIGYYQERGKPKRIVPKGEVIRCLPGVEHWHGASAETGVTYVAASPVQKGPTVWLQKVTDEEYSSNSSKNTIMNKTNNEHELITLSKQKWQWMADKNVDSLNLLFHEKSMFVHMGGTWGKDREVEIIKTGFIWYKEAEVYSASVNIIGNTAILLNDIDLVAVVGGNEVVNPFMVTEVYVNENGKWKMGSLTFSKLARAVKIEANKK